MHRRFLIALLTAGLAAPASANADGLPVLGFAPNNTSVHGGHLIYSARVSGSHTRLQRRTAARRLIRAARISGRFAVPVVAYDGSVSGLSADGRTLVLIRPRIEFPQRRTALAVIDPGTLTIRRRIPLSGDFSFDAVAPDGRWIYLIQYISNNPTQYRVRALDAVSGRLLPHDIVDPHDRGEAMRGSPLTRVASPDGRWAYTLYDGNGHPFVHALDTAGRTARCIDLPAFPAASNPWVLRLHLVPAADRLLVTLGRRTLAAIDTRTRSVVRRGGTPRAPQRAATTPGVLLVIVAIGAAGAAAYGARRSIVQRLPGSRVYRSRS